MRDASNHRPTVAPGGLERLAASITGLEPLVERRSFDVPMAAAFARARLVSFDLFDTLVRRPFLEPAHLFAWIELQSDLPGFAAARRAAEQAARAQNHGRSDVTLAEIHSLLPGYGALELEIAAEIALTYPRTTVNEVLLGLQAAGKPVAVVTDTSLDRRTISAIIARIGAEPGHLVISSGDGTAKSDGSSFRLLAETSGIAPAGILHVGDDPVRDFQHPVLFGMAALHLRRLLPSLAPGSALVRCLLARLASSGGLAETLVGAALRDCMEAPRRPSPGP